MDGISLRIKFVAGFVICRYIKTAGVIPVIFASSLLSIPNILASVIKNDGFTLFAQKYLDYTTPVGFLLY